jgi:hypothetical protein
MIPSKVTIERNNSKKTYNVFSKVSSGSRGDELLVGGSFPERTVSYNFVPGMKTITGGEKITYHF